MRGYNEGMSKETLPRAQAPHAVPAAAGSPVRFSAVFAGGEALLALVGAGIAGALWWADQTRQDLPCSSGGGCAAVAASAWSHVDLVAVHHVPVALLGLLGYVLLFSLAMLRLGLEDSRWDRRLHALITLVSGGGMAYSWFLQWIAHAEVGAFCMWCRSSAIVMTLLFAAAVWEWRAVRPQR